MVKKPIKITLVEFEAHISDQLTRITLEHATGKITGDQYKRECADLAQWATDRMKYLSTDDQIKFAMSQAREAVKHRGGKS